MNTMLKRMKVIYLPFLLISTGFIIVYSFLNWFFIIKTETISINEDLVNFWLPFTLPWIPILLWLRPRIGVIQLKGWRGNLAFLYLVVAAFAIAAPTIVAQFYLSTATGTMAHVVYVSEIDPIAHTKYYTVDNIYIDRELVGVDIAAKISGNHNEYLNLEIFVASPMFDPQLYPKFEHNIWYVIKYEKQISNRLSDSEKEKQTEAFSDASQADFYKRDFKAFSYLEKLGNNDDRRSFQSAIRKSPVYQPNKSAILLKPQQGSYESRNGNKFEWIFGSFGIGAAIWFVMIIFPKVDEIEMTRLLQGKLSHDKTLKEAQKFFLPRRGFYVTPILMSLNILVFLIMVFDGLGVISFRVDDLLEWGANYGPYVREGDLNIMRLVVSMFLHGGLMHLVWNMYALIFVGSLLEPMLGSIKFFLAYLITGIVGNLASILYYDATVSVGASGAILGLFGALTLLVFTKKKDEDPIAKNLLRNILFFVGVNLLLGGIESGIDNAAHVGGLVCGMLFGAIIVYMKHMSVVSQKNDYLSEINEDNYNEDSYEERMRKRFEARER